MAVDIFNIAFNVIKAEGQGSIEHDVLNRLLIHYLEVKALP